MCRLLSSRAALVLMGPTSAWIRGQRPPAGAGAERSINMSRLTRSAETVEGLVLANWMVLATGWSLSRMVRGALARAMAQPSGKLAPLAMEMVKVSSGSAVVSSVMMTKKRLKFSLAAMVRVWVPELSSVPEP